MKMEEMRKYRVGSDKEMPRFAAAYLTPGSGWATITLT